MTRSSNVPLDDSTSLMRRVADNDIEAFETLHKRCFPVLMHLFISQHLDRASAEDLVQRIFIALWHQRKSFRGESSFETYLFSMARRTLNKELRRFHQLAEIDVTEVLRTQVDSHTSGQAPGLSIPEAELYLQELIDALDAAKTKLTAEQRQALEVSQAIDRPLDRVLNELGCSRKAYKSRLKRARKRLKELLASFLEEQR
jgi:RNA polymerase sigma-70 factor (ECF subfamily)